MKKINVNRESSVTWLTLFSTMGTLVCCAIPIFLVSLGMGATVAALVSNLPFLVVLSQHKPLVFGLSGSMLLIAGWLNFRASRSCPADPKLAALCARTHRWNIRIYWAAVILWALGFFAAFLSLPLTLWLEQ